jgi:hypothetical protein
MSVLSFSDYLPLSELAKILAVAPVVAVMAPAAVSVGLDRREHGETGSGTALLAVGVGLPAVLVGVGLYALVHQ